MNFLEIKIGQNTLLSIGISLLIFLICISATIVLQYIISRRLKKWAIKKNLTKVEYIIELVQKNVLPPLYFGSVWVSEQNLSLPAQVDAFFSKTAVAIFTFFLVKGLVNLVKYFFETYWLNKEEKSNISKGVMPAVSIVIWVLGILFLIDNLGFDISGLIAGLGIGGIAVAIASQAILGDVFNYFTILLDKPFEIGDFIIAGDILGVIEHIGLKTTRIRSLWGEQIILTNTNLMNSKIRNYKRMEERRVEFKFGVEYATPLEKLQEIPGIIKQIIQETENTRFDRAHFFSYNEYYLEFVVVYYIYSPDYNLYMDIQQKINLRMNEQFRDRDIIFAFPTQNIILEQKK